MRARLAVSLAVALIAAPPAAHAGFPGANGRLVVSVDTCEFNPHLRAIAFTGESLGPLTRPCEVLGVDEDEEDVIRSAQAPEFTPDGQRLLFQQGGVDPAGFYTMAADGSDHQPVPGGGNGDQPSLSPDGRRIAFMRDRAVWTMALDGSDQRRLRSRAPCPKGRGNCVHLDEPRWSPDGRYIAIRADQWAYGPGKPPWPRPGLWLIDPETGKYVRRVVAGDRAGRAPFEPDWSPDGRRLVYRTAFEQQEIKGGASGGNIFVVDRTGRNRRRVVHRKRLAEAHPVWSPDGRYIAWIGLSFGSGDVGFDVRSTLMRMALRGGSPKRVRPLPGPYVEESYYHLPELAWQPLPSG
ncbi:MAG TPA: hypothetical protein VM266_09455 [Solirubrobacteraceae bacterium]|nr:hypothetical protein [Solirubrobacteraceae bacterium]